MSTLPENQRMARVTISEPQWRQFRALAVSKRRSIAAYLGWLVQKEVARAERVETRRSVREAPALPVEEREPNEVWIPPWEI